MSDAAGGTPMKALVLSGGLGSRLRPFSHSIPKQLMPIANKPVLQYVIENIRDIGITEIGIIVGGRAAEVSAALGDGAGLGVRITYLRQSRPLGLAHCVLIAKPFLGTDDFIMYLGDNMLPDGIGEFAERSVRTRPAVHFLVQKVADPRAFGVAELDKDGTVMNLEEKPSWPRSHLAVMGVYFFTRAIHEAITAIGFSARGELEITNAIQWLLARGVEVKASEYHGYWKDTGRPEDVLDCNRRMLGELRSSIAGDVDQASELRGPVVIAAGARVKRSRIEGPAVIGAGTLIEESSIGPDTSIGRDCVLRDTAVADSIVMDGAAISNVQDLRDCLIGRSACVCVVEPGRGHHQLVVGDDARIQFGIPQPRSPLEVSG